MEDLVSLKKDFNYLLIDLGITKHYMSAEVMGYGKIDKKTRDLLERIDRYLHQDSPHRSYGEDVGYAKRKIEERLTQHIVNVGVECYRLADELSRANREEDKELRKELMSVRSELNKYSDNLRNSRFFGKGTDDQISVLQGLYKQVGKVKAAIYKLDQIVKKVEEEKKITVESIKKIGLVALVIIALFSAITILPVEPVGNYVYAPLFGTYAAIFSIVILSMLILIFRRK